ncbi:MAG: ABC transporter permease [Marmoricola sp.]|nr:ABC transporter permease [Marmoricola sp.]
MSTVTGVGELARLSVRRDRVLVLVWVLVLVAVCYASAASTRSLYPHEADRVAAAQSINASPAVVALYGPILDVRSLGELSMTKMTVLYAVFVAILAVLVVRRHTRVEEESGRAELLGGTAIGRDALLVAAVSEGVAVSVVVGVLGAVAAAAGGLPAAGSLAFGASWTGIGLVGTGLAALACQLSASARTCGALAAAGLGVLFVLRAVGDTTSLAWLRWTSPFGWSTQLRAWSDPRWWVLLLYVVAATVLVAGAHVLRSRRDLGAGIVPDRPGPAQGAPRLADAVALAVRQHTASLATWTAAMVVLGLLMGAIAPAVGDMLHSPSARAMMQRLGGIGALQDTLVAAELSVMAVVITCFAITVVGHSGADEHDGRTEQVLATATSRARSYAAVLVVAVLGSAWLLLVTGLAVAVGLGSAAGDPGHGLGRVLAAALAQAPAVWLVTALAVAAFALRSRWSAAGWVLLVLFLTLGQLGELLRLPAWVIHLSPYVRVPRMPVEPFAWGPTVAMTVLAAGFLAVGWLGYRTRDIG